MGFQVVIVALLIAAGIGFAVLNPSVLYEPRSVQFPWGMAEVPLVLGLLGIAGASLLLVLLLGLGTSATEARARRRLESLLAEREHEIAVLKANAYDEVSRKIDALREEIAGMPVRERVASA